MATREEVLETLVQDAVKEGRDLGEESQAIIDEIEAEQQKSRVKALSVKERLRRRLLSGYIDIPFEDQDGTFNIRMRVPDPSQRQQMIAYQMEAEKALDEEDEKTLIELDRKMAELMGEVCIDLDADYIQAGQGFGVDVIPILLGVIVGSVPVNMEDYQFFRSPSPGS